MPSCSVGGFRCKEKILVCLSHFLKNLCSSDPEPTGLPLTWKNCKIPFSESLSLALNTVMLHSPPNRELFLAETPRNDVTLWGQGKPVCLWFLFKTVTGASPAWCWSGVSCCNIVERTFSRSSKNIKYVYALWPQSSNSDHLISGNHQNHIEMSYAETCSSHL